MNKKIFALAGFLIIFAALFGGLAYASSSSSGSANDVSIDRVRANGNVLAQDKTNFLEDNIDNIDIVVGLTAIKDVSNIHVDAILTDESTGNTVADSTGNFMLNANQSTLVALNLRLIDRLRREKNFRLEVKVVDIDGNKETKFFGIKFTGGRLGTGNLDVSIDRTIVNGRVVASSQTNFIEKSNSFNVEVDFTALEDLNDARVEAVLRDLESSNVVADTTDNFDLANGASSSRTLSLNLLDKLKNSNSFELTVRIADAEGHSTQQRYGITMREKGAVSGGGAGRSLDISIDSAEVEDKTLAENENTFVNLNNFKKNLNLRVRLTSLENVQDAHIDAILSFENGVVVADATSTFDLSKGSNSVKSLELPLIGKFEQNNFRLRVRVINPDGNVEEKTYGIILNQNKFPFVISSILLNPENKVQAGKSLEVKATFKNNGVVPFDGVNLKVSIPELDISSTKFIDAAKANKAVISEEFLLPILDDVQTGTYNIRFEILSQFGSLSAVKEVPVSVLGKSEQSTEESDDRLVVNVPIAEQDINNDGSEAVYPITLTNEGSKAHSYSLLFDNAGWANLRLSDSSAFVISPQETKTVNVYVSAKENAKDEKSFLVTIKRDDRILTQVSLKGSIVNVSSSSIKSSTIFGIFLIGFFVLLVVALFFGIRHMQGSSAKEKEPEKYYTENYY